MEGKKDEDFGALSASFFSSFLDDHNDENYNAVAEKEDVILLRFPICCVTGHGYTGKTVLLNYIRGDPDFQYDPTKRIGATYVPSDYIVKKTKELKPDNHNDNFPGLLFLDTPGLTSFTNIMSQGLALCDIAILFIDMFFQWKPCYNAPFAKAYKQQCMDTQNAFNMKLTQIISQFKEHGISTEIYWKNKEMGETISIVPISAKCGEGIPDLLLLLVMYSKTMLDKLTYKEELQCTILDVGFHKGRGTMIHVVLMNGTICEGDRIVGQILTSIQSLWAPRPREELGVKGNYLQYKKIKGVMPIKIFAQGIEDAIRGSNLYLVNPGDDSKDVEETILEDKKQQD
ncbi:hypothetical protein TSUD_338030 [Trifolium subterraneum]|uniref:Tr-type G domain-containing protein n=1 Tax=Trifolium subterraneum TaxID=3900 RepID=A0A2Z6LPD1_TRISU|nr:hypothetical protein TSUD_338030 [Trifolium subterraneum]